MKIKMSKEALHPDLQQLLVKEEVKEEEEVPAEQQKDPGPPHLTESQQELRISQIKGEQEELWISQQGEQLQEEPDPPHIKQELQEDPKHEPRGRWKEDDDDDGEEWTPPSFTRRDNGRDWLSTSDEEESDWEEEEEEEHPPASSSSTVGRKGAGMSCPPPLDPRRWRETPDWSPKTLPFTAVPGPRAAASLQSDNPVDFAELFFCDELLLLIVDQTNFYAEQCIDVLDELGYTYINTWEPLSVVDLKRFLGLLFLTGIIKKQSIAEYWSVDVALETPYFRKTMSLDRFKLIWRFLHFRDNREVDDSDRLYKVRLVLNLLLSKFRDMYQPSQNISLDEGILSWKQGRVHFRVYSPAKPNKKGIKSYTLCDSASGYCYTMTPYCGTNDTLRDVVYSLFRGLEGFGYRLWLDHFSMSAPICQILLDRQIHSAGTLRVWRGEPPAIREVTTSDLAVGERRARHNGTVMALAWRNNNRITRMISTFHQDEMTTVAVRQAGQSENVPPRQPACVVGYNQYMTGVDRLDQNISYYPLVRRKAKWTSKFVVYMMQIAMSNAFIVYRARNPTTSCRTLKDFILSVVKSWTGGLRGGARGGGGGPPPPAPPLSPPPLAADETEACPPPPAPPLRPPPLAADDQPPLPLGRRTSVRTRKRSSSARLDVNFAGHVPLAVEVPPAKKKAPYRKCAHCAAKGERKETKYVCPRCDHVPLCLYPCYFEYHSQ